MFFYRYFHGQGRADLAFIFQADDPFALPPADIVDSILAIGFVADVTKHRAEKWPTVGRVHDVHREGQEFLVAIGRDAEMISVQEIRPNRYLPIE